MADDPVDDPRAEHIEYRAGSLARQKAAESRQAAAMLRDFTEKATAAGIPAIPLRARAYRGDTLYRTNVVGWYLRRDRSVGVSTDGAYYILSAPTSFGARFSGVTLTPSDPPLELGRGARDGESMPLPEAIRRRLAAGTDFPA